MLGFKLTKEHKNKLVALCAFLLFFVFSYYTDVPLKLLHININSMSMLAKQIYLIAYEIITLSVFIFIYHSDLERDFNDFKVNCKKYFKENIKYWLIALAVMYASNMIIAFLKYSATGDISAAANEEAIHASLSNAPLYTFIAAAFIAPIIEELTFRKSLRVIFNNKFLFILISSFIFGGLHVFTSDVALFDLLYLIPYCAPGVAFAYILVKTNNICNTISLHLLHNGILMILQLVLLSRGIL